MKFIFLVIYIFSHENTKTFWGPRSGPDPTNTYPPFACMTLHTPLHYIGKIGQTITAPPPLPNPPSLLIMDNDICSLLTFQPQYCLDKYVHMFIKVTVHVNKQTD